ncbi:MAG: NAD-dependent DNA ligase LigA, partial [Eubacteriales bacterium]|nr:NAD-dependent DNA ligase LigA [Eubacteriales bacterium]
MDRMRELVDQLNDHAYRYYVLDDPIISDREYDALYDELTRLERETGRVLDDSPTRRVGDTVLPEFESVRHNGPLHSLDKAKTFDEVRAWAARAEKLVSAYEKESGESLPPITYVLEYKFDGLTINLLYEDGMLVRGASRGNGIVGENITPQVRTINSVPLSIP